MADPPFRLYDHIDLRVRDLVVARAFYDPLMHALGMRGRQSPHDVKTWVYIRVHHRVAHEAFTLTEDERHLANDVRIAFAATSHEELDRVAEGARAAGARNFEAPHLCPEYTATYYAAFFDDPDGNRLEIVYRQRVDSESTAA